jgi:hypothetical protein
MMFLRMGQIRAFCKKIYVYRNIYIAKVKAHAAVRWLAWGLCGRMAQTTTRWFPAVGTGDLRSSVDQLCKGASQVHVTFNL